MNLLQAQRTKRLRTLRNTARELVRDLGGKLSSYGKIVAKSRPKVIAALVDLKQYDSVRSSTFEPLSLKSLT